MDLVNRIKAFLNSQNISSSQFADTSDIPRPTLSQILNGRNKKISDEIIRKIHVAYPSLSVQWLLFGEGEMLVTENIPLTKPQDGDIIDFSAPNTTDIQDNKTSTSPNPFATEFASDSKSLFDDSITLPEHPLPEGRITEADSIPQPKLAQAIPIPTDGTKKIVNIMVFYSDNSFESFYPAGNQ